MNTAKPTQVIGIVSGKGGVGKTTVSVNLAVALAARGRRVMLFDADLSLANAQILLGCRAEYNMSHFLSGEKSLTEIVVKTRHGVWLVPGASGLQEMADLNELQMARIVQEFSSLDQEIDVLIVDLPAGISPAVMTLLAACSLRFVVVQDDPSSIADAYGTIKVMMKDHGMDAIHLIPNAVETEGQGQLLFQRINQVCARFLEQTIHYLGSIERDDQILQSLKKFQPVLEYAPSSAGARDFRRLAESTDELPVRNDFNGGIQFFIERLAQKA
jgi:flagellar biosynthesis protein FlhG